MTDETASTGFRIAIREEGQFINAYLAPVGTMIDARHLASLNKDFANFPGVFKMFQEFCACTVATILDQEFGIKTEFFAMAPNKDMEGHG